MDAKHTPGPWVTYNGVMVVTHNAPIAHCGDIVMDGKADLPEAEANARLIAAAPCLLEACEAVRDTCLCDPDVTPKFQLAWDSMLAAIRKARGETLAVVGGSPSNASAADDLAEACKQQTVGGGTK